jgi:type I restriction enzyme R subunit/putative DNA methylase
MTHGRAFVAMDRELDYPTIGPLWLKDPPVADCVSRVLLSGATDWHLFELDAWVLMANHVHALLRPLVPLQKALMNIKSASARAANGILGRAGEPFWQGESYDHWVRSSEERGRIIRYIEFNPVNAGLVEAPELWRWSSAGWPRMAPPHTVQT